MKVIWWIQTKGRVDDTNLEALAKLKPVFAANGVVTAGMPLETSPMVLPSWWS